MFTGIVEEMGIIEALIRRNDSMVLKIKCEKVLKDSGIGDSIAVNGVCQTVTTLDSSSFTVDVLKESLRKTTLGRLKKGSIVNLERALTLNKPIGGHIVQGHIQGCGRVETLIQSGKNLFLTVKIPTEMKCLMVPEGSIAIDGLSLTIAKVYFDKITINIIPHTFNNSIVKNYRVGDFVNIEPDILVKTSIKKESLTEEKLLSWGY